MSFLLSFESLGSVSSEEIVYLSPRAYKIEEGELYSIQKPIKLSCAVERPKSSAKHELIIQPNCKFTYTCEVKTPTDNFKDVCRGTLRKIEKRKQTNQKKEFEFFCEKHERTGTKNFLICNVKYYGMAYPHFQQFDVQFIEKSKTIPVDLVRVSLKKET